MDLINTDEVAEILGVTRRRVNALATERKDFPRPAFEQRTQRATRRLWRRAAIEKWARTANRAPGRRYKAAA